MLSNRGKVLAAISAIAISLGMASPAAATPTGDAAVTASGITGATPLTNPTVRTPPTTIDSTCGADVTAALDAWIKSIPNNSRIDFAAGKCYLIQGSLMLRDRVNLHIDGNGSTFKATSFTSGSDRAQWWLGQASNVVLEDMKLSGPHTAVVPLARDSKHDHNIMVRGGSKVSIRNVTGGNTEGDFIWIGRGTNTASTLYTPKNVRIENVTGTNIGRMGIAMEVADGVLVNRANIGRTSLHQIDFEPQVSNRPLKNITVANSTFGEAGWATFAFGTPLAVTGIDFSNITLAGNRQTVEAGGECRPPVEMSSNKHQVKNLTIDDNRLLTRGHGMSLKLADTVKVRNNIVGLVGGCGGAGRLVTNQVTNLTQSGNQWAASPSAVTG
jgi:hypothetical protein